jgi:hypothetical protein
MTLNLPIIDAISDCKAVLIAEMGGGYDVFCGLSIYFELKRLGKVVVQTYRHFHGNRG